MAITFGRWRITLSGIRPTFGALCQIIVVIVCQAVRIFLPSTCWSGDRILWFVILLSSVKPCVRLGVNGLSILMPGRCCPTTCIVFGRYHRVTMTFPTDGNRSKFALCKQFPAPSGDPPFELPKVNGASGNDVSGNMLSAMKRITNII